jgi:hypothetical protein
MPNQLEIKDGSQRASMDRKSITTASCGPKTRAGKAISRLNATCHGIFSSLRVLPTVERQLDWDLHFSSTINDLKPVGYLERNLAERVALFLWRLGRVARHERESAALLQEEVVEHVTERRSFRGLISGSRSSQSPPPGSLSNPKDALVEAVRTKKALSLLDGFSGLSDATQLTPDQATGLIFCIEAAAEVDINGPDFPPFPGVPDDLPLEEFKGWDRSAGPRRLEGDSRLCRRERRDSLCKSVRECPHRIRGS